MIPLQPMKFFHQLVLSPLRYPKLDLASTFEAWWLSNLEATLINSQHWKNAFPDSILLY